MKTYRGVEVLTLGLDGDEWSDSRPDHFNPGDITPGIHCVGDVVGPRAGLDAVQ
jgi:hypothetical protein